MQLDRRTFLKLGTATAGLVAATGSVAALARADELQKGGRDFSRKTGKERKAIPSVCLQCVSGCGILGYVEDGRLVKIEGNPEHPNNRGTICAKGQAGINQVYDPDRILYPLKRVGKRGEGKWKRISWEEALEEVAGRMKALRDAGKPEEFVFHYGRNRIPATINRFTDAFGTPAVFNHTSICESSKQVAGEITYGKSIDINDVAHTKYILNFGCNIYEAHVIHSSFAQRVIEGRVNNHAKLVTFDVRLSNTAGRSDEWIPIKPGTDGLVALAMANVIMQEGLYDADFINNFTNVSVAQLKQHLQQYTPEMAEKISGVPAETIVRIAREFATTKPATTVSYRGVCAHINGAMNERCVILLNIITGNINKPGTFCLPVEAKLIKEQPDPVPLKAKGKNGILDYWKKHYPEASHGVSHTVLPLIKEGVHKVSIYMTYMYNPAYSNPQTKLMEEILKDENLIPYHVAITPFVSEGAALADIILPECTYLERWEPETRASYELIPFVALRQPVIPPLGESKEFRWIIKELALRIGGGMERYFQYESSEAFVRAQVEKFVPDLAKDGGFEYLKAHGVWYDKNKKPAYYSHLKPLKSEELVDTKVDTDGTIYKEIEKDGKITREVVGLMYNGTPVKGFPGSAHKVTARLAVFAEPLEEHGFPAFPSFVPIDEHQNLKDDELILTTYKVAVHTQSRTANCKWLAEISHINPLWVHPQTAAKFGLKTGDEVIVTSKVGSKKTRVLVTEGVHPKVVCFAGSHGHWEYGRIAQAKAFRSETVKDPDTELIWWKDNGVHLNEIIPVNPDPIGGNQAWMDTVVTIKKA